MIKLNSLSVPLLFLLLSCSSESNQAGSTNANESTPSLTVNQSTTINISPFNNVSIFHVAENTLSVGKVMPSDTDHSLIRYSLLGDDEDAFSVSSQGEIHFLQVPDYEQKNIYHLIIQAQVNNITHSKALLISVTDQEESQEAQVTLAISSDAFKYTGKPLTTLPLTYTCEGANGGISPLLHWDFLPEPTQSVVVAMHHNDRNSWLPHFTLYNISGANNTLLADDFSIGEAIIGDSTDKAAYIPPCAVGAGHEEMYTFSVYALSSPLTITAEATQADVMRSIVSADSLISSQTLTVSRVFWDAEALINNLHVPNSVPDTCEEKTAHFNEYASVHKSITCDDDNNQISIVSHIASGLKTPLNDQQHLVGIETWIGKVVLPQQSGLSLPLRPTYHEAAQDNMSCNGSTNYGVTVDGQMMLPWHQSFGEDGLCGPFDGRSYATKDILVRGGVDQCYGHGPALDGYHLHGIPICLMDIHDPSKPIAYMSDGIPLYFGQGGGKSINQSTLSKQTL